MEDTDGVFFESKEKIINAKPRKTPELFDMSNA